MKILGFWSKEKENSQFACSRKKVSVLLPPKLVKEIHFVVYISLDFPVFLPAG